MILKNAKSAGLWTSFFSIDYDKPFIDFIKVIFSCRAKITRRFDAHYVLTQRAQRALYLTLMMITPIVMMMMKIGMRSLKFYRTMHMVIMLKTPTWNAHEHKTQAMNEIEMFFCCYCCCFVSFYIRMIWITISIDVKI